MRNLAVSARPWERRPRVGVAGLALFAITIGSVPAWPSCQTMFCQRDRSRVAALREAELYRRVAASPTDSAAWEDLLRETERRPAYQRYAAQFDALYQWSPQPLLELDLDAERRERHEQLLGQWRAADPNNGRSWCVEAWAEPSPESGVAILRSRLDHQPEDWTVARCLADALVATGAVDEAIRVLTDLSDRGPNEIGIWDALVGALEKAGRHDDLRQALEERSRRFPAVERSTRDLVGFYDRTGLVAERDRLVAQLAESPDGETRWNACSGLRRRSAERFRCNLRLLAELPAAADVPPEKSFHLHVVRSGILDQAIHAKDWSALRQILSLWPKEDLLSAWGPITDWLDADGCAALMTAWRAGELAGALAGSEPAAQAARFGSILRRCGESAAADEVIAPFAAAADEDTLRRMGGEASRRELALRSASRDSDVAVMRSLDDVQRALPANERLPNLRAWHAADNGDPEPARRLAAFAATEIDRAAAVEWLRQAADRKPDDLDLRLEVGALALRFREHPAAVAAAQRVLAADALPRQRAEAHYILGRVALREGRREEAATELLAYFPLRLRYAGCCGVPHCDRGLLLLLVGNHDHEGLRSYLTERDAAIGWFARTLHYANEEQRRQSGLVCLGDRLLVTADAETVMECVPRVDDSLGVAELDALFADDQLLSLAGKLTAIN